MIKILQMNLVHAYNSYQEVDSKKGWQAVSSIFKNDKY